jgi:hypothetical protein
MGRSIVVLLIVAAGCAGPKVIRQGEGWKETETSVEVTSEDPRLLAELATTHADARIRAAAIAKVSDATVLTGIVRTEKDPALRKGAVDRVDDEAVLAEIARSDPDPAVQQAAAARRDLLRTVGSGHVEYASWAAAKPGTWVRLRLDLQVGDRRSTADVSRKLVACRPDRAVFEQRDVATGRGVQGITRDLLSGYDLAVGQTESDTGELEVGGKKVKCRWTRWSFTKGGDIVRIRRWFHEAVPGGIARVDLEVAPLGDAQRVLTARVTSWGN